MQILAQLAQAVPSTGLTEQRPATATFSHHSEDPVFTSGLAPPPPHEPVPGPEQGPGKSLQLTLKLPQAHSFWPSLQMPLTFPQTDSICSPFIYFVLLWHPILAPPAGSTLRGG